MKTWMLWHGGPNYRPSAIPDDLEIFDTLRDAREAFEHRAGSWDAYYPGVKAAPPDQDGPTAWLYFYDPTGELDPYPQRILECGPRGGLRESEG